MRSPLASSILVEYDQVESTQDLAIADVKDGGSAGVILAFDQTKGRGRFDREWISHPGESLTMSLIFREYADHPKPHLIGMAMAIAAAGAIHSQIRWPNDLTIHQRKVGGILTELISDPSGRLIPVVGIGINLNQTTFPPEIADLATSVHLQTHRVYDPREMASAIINRMATLPEPNNWTDLAIPWSLFDDTPGKRYKLFSGEEGTALSVGGEGQLLCAVDGETVAVLAAEALFTTIPPGFSSK